MRHGHTSLNLTKAFFAFVTLGLAAACSDAGVAPTVKAPAFKAPPAFDIVVGTHVFTVNTAEDAIERFGDHVLFVPAGAICDPALSTYGATEWDNACVPLKGSIEITATMMRDNDNHPYVDFQPALRFDPSKNVLLFLRNGLSQTATELGMQYCNNDGYCVDETLADPSLAPFRVGKTSMLGRRIKHFSGYLVQAGAECPGTLTEEPNGTWMCWDEAGDGSTRRSGYMVASGLDDEDITGVNKDSKDSKDEKKSDSQQ
jgi:hypothetical protein